MAVVRRDHRVRLGGVGVQRTGELFGLADFSWNENGYDPERNYGQVAEYLGGNNPVVAAHLLAFFDVNHLAPATGEDTTWQPQAPVLAAKFAEFHDGWENGDRHAAIDALWDYAWILDQSPIHIQQSVVDPGFAQDANAWLDAVGYWGEALLTTLNGLASRVDGVEWNAQQRFAEAAELVRHAETIQVPPGENNIGGPVKIGDGVLDEFLRTAPDVH